jgi:hypothetical protein
MNRNIRMVIFRTHQQKTIHYSFVSVALSHLFGCLSFKLFRMSWNNSVLGKFLTLPKQNFISCYKNKNSIHPFSHRLIKECHNPKEVEYNHWTRVRRTHKDFPILCVVQLAWAQRFKNTSGPVYPWVPHLFCGSNQLQIENI